MAPTKAMDRLRTICLSLPEAYEQETWNSATFRVRGKIFCMASHDSVAPSMSVKATRQEQKALLAQGDPYFLPAYVGHMGWIGVSLAEPLVPWDEVAELVTESYRQVAPKRLSAGLL